MCAAHNREALICKQQAQSGDMEELRHGQNGAIAALAHGCRSVSRGRCRVDAQAVLNDAVGQNAMLDKVSLHCRGFVHAFGTRAAAYEYDLALPRPEDGKRGIKPALETVGERSISMDGVAWNDNGIRNLDVIGKADSR
jgi:hypothetical protein